MLDMLQTPELRPQGSRTAYKGYLSMPSLGVFMEDTGQGVFSEDRARVLRWRTMDRGFLIEHETMKSLFQNGQKTQRTWTLRQTL